MPSSPPQESSSSGPTPRHTPGASWVDVLMVLVLLVALTLDLALLAVGGLLLTSPADTLTKLRARLPWWGQAAILISLGVGASAPMAALYTIQRLHRRAIPTESPHTTS